MSKLDKKNSLHQIEESTYFGPSIIYNVKEENKTENDDSAKKQEEKNSKNSEDVLTSVIGEFGPYQLIWSILLGSTGITTGMLVFSNKFFTSNVSK